MFIVFSSQLEELQQYAQLFLLHVPAFRLITFNLVCVVFVNLSNHMLHIQAIFFLLHYSEL